jgi:hydrogenase expression/formation protein HypE
MSDPAPDMARMTCPVPAAQGGRIVLGHGGGGVLSRELIDRVFLPAFANPVLSGLADSAILPPEWLAAAGGGGAVPGGARLAFSTDSYVVQPLLFPGGSIGDLAINGTVNDLAMSGAKPLALSAAFILEEGLDIGLLTRVVADMGRAARRAGVEIVTGDTKVVERGRGDGLSITTAGIGLVPAGSRLGAMPPGPGDVILVSGTVGDHGMAVMSVREGLAFEAAIESDSAPLHELVADLLAACPDARLLRDPTRGGVATTLGEMVTGRGIGVEFDEAAVPVAPMVAAACELLGLDPLHVASEGRLVAVVSERDAAAAWRALAAHPLGTRAARIGRIVAEHPGVVVARTALGGSRIVPMPHGEQLPRIC